jgi:hypothetical protein
MEVLYVKAGVAYSNQPTLNSVALVYNDFENFLSNVNYKSFI